MKKRIIIVGPAFPLRGGIANFNEALCRTLNESGHHCTIVSFTLQYPGFLFPGTSQKAEQDTPPKNLKIDTLVNSVNPISWFKTAAFINKENPDIVIFRYWIPFMAPGLGTIARNIKRSAKKVKVVAIADNIIPHESRFGDHALTTYFVKAIDSFIVMSKSVADDLKKFTKSKPVIVLPHPVYDIFGAKISKNQARANLNFESGEKLVLFFGFIRRYKGLDLLLQAFADERLKAMGVKLIVAGEFYDDKQPYTGLIQKLGLTNSVVLHDHYIDKQKVAEYFCAADVVVQPYREATQSGVTQIAYHFGKPMIVTDVGGLPEIVHHGKSGYVTKVDPEAIASALVDFYEHNREGELSQGSAEVAQSYTWDHFVQSLLEFTG